GLLLPRFLRAADRCKGVGALPFMPLVHLVPTLCCGEGESSGGRRDGRQGVGPVRFSLAADGVRKGGDDRAPSCTIVYCAGHSDVFLTRSARHARRNWIRCKG